MTQHVHPSPPLPKVSGRAQLDHFPADRNSTLRKASPSHELVFRWEAFHTISGELLPLFRRHYQEIALDKDVVALDPDWDTYHALDLTGRLHILTARHRGKLVGYVFNLISGHLHYVSTRVAHTEMFWLDPAFRKGWLPVKMFQENLAGLKEREVVISSINFKLHFKDARVGKLLARIGYLPTDIVLRKVL